MAENMGWSRRRLVGGLSPGENTFWLLYCTRVLYPILNDPDPASSLNHESLMPIPNPYSSSVLVPVLYPDGNVEAWAWSKKRGTSLDHQDQRGTRE